MHELLVSKLSEMKTKIFDRHGTRPSLLPAGASLQPNFVARSYTLVGGHKTRRSMGSTSALQSSSIFHDDELSHSNTPSPKLWGIQTCMQIFVLSQRNTPVQSTIGLGFRSPLMTLGSTASMMGMQRQHSSSNKRMSNTSSISGDGKVTVLNQEVSVMINLLIDWLTPQ